MKLIKHAHACVEIDAGLGSLLVDPGTFTADASELLTHATAVLITHEHFDHLDADALDAALARRPELPVWGPAAAIGRWADTYPDRVHEGRAGDTFVAAGLTVQVHGESHALIHPDIPRIDNVGYLIGGIIYHPGDSYDVPNAEVSTLLLPVSGPWTKLAEAVDFVRAVAPDRLVQIHEVMLSETGLGSMATFLSPDMLGPIPLTQLASGESIEI